MKIDVIEKVVEEIIKLRYNKGYSTGNLVKYLNKKYDLKATRSYELIRIAREKIGEYNYITNENTLEDAIEMLEQMLQRALDNENDKLALSIQQEINKVNQLYIQKIDITSQGEKITININGDKS